MSVRILKTRVKSTVTNGKNIEFFNNLLKFYPKLNWHIYYLYNSSMIGYKLKMQVIVLDF